MPNDFTVMLRTELMGDLMDMYEKDKKISFYYTIIGGGLGEIVFDGVVELDWPEMHYNTYDCICTYNPAYEIDEKYSETNSNEEDDCVIYHLYLNGNDLIVNLSLRGDRRNTYEISLNYKGELNWERHNIDTLSLEHNLPHPNSIKTEEDKAKFFKSYLDSKYDQLVSPPQVQPLYDSLTKTYTLEDKNIQLIPLSDEACTPTKIKGENWEIYLNGSLFIDPEKDQPLVNFIGDKMLIVTVYNDDVITCPTLSDTYPLIYFINMEAGRKNCQTLITYGLLKEIDGR
ncbi:MAG: hypothetical protein M9916_11280 [Crocinitomicaceae bacterium]|nr:hypothetical protein [Crocinitomicaceae bacterium]